MDSTAANWNLTIDDFDSILDYADQGAWKIPDASVPDFVRSDKPVLRGTYHLTDKDTSVSLNFTGLYSFPHLKKKRQDTDILTKTMIFRHSMP